MIIAKTINKIPKIFKKLRPILLPFMKPAINFIDGRRRFSSYGEPMWAEKDSDLRRRKPADLQSAPFDRFGIDPYKNPSKNNVSRFD